MGRENHKIHQKKHCMWGIKPQKTQNDTEKRYAQSHMQSCAQRRSFIIHHSSLGTVLHAVIFSCFSWFLWLKSHVKLKKANIQKEKGLY